MIAAVSLAILLVVAIFSAFILGYFLGQGTVDTKRRTVLESWRAAYLREEARNSGKEFPWPHDVACPICNAAMGFPCNSNDTYHGARLLISPGAVQAKYGGPKP